MTEEQIFLAALELTDATERNAFLEKACGADARLRGQVEKLLAAHFRSGGTLGDSILSEVAHKRWTPTHDDTVSLDGAREPAGSGDKTRDEDPDDLHFLQPSSRRDSLGRLDQYEILQVLGRGGFGVVFRGFDEMLQRVVAIKVLAPAIAVTSPARKRFSREARSSAKIRHENVVQIYAVGEQPLPYLVMEYVPGESLQQRIDRTGPLEVREILHLGRQIAEGLAAAHATGLIHRDIKPANVLIEGGPLGRVRITDFGLARAADDASLTQSGMVAGTPLYMAPEQAKGETLDHRADLFSLGSVLYVLTSGRPPFRAPTTFGVLKRVVDDMPRAISELIPETPRWLCDIISKLHAKDPEDRFQSARDVADALANCEAKLNTKTAASDVTPLVSDKPSSAQPATWKWFAAGVLLMGLVALAVMEVMGVTQWLNKQERLPPLAEKGGKPSPTITPKDRESPKEGATPRPSEVPDRSTLPVGFSDVDIRRIAALPAWDQIEEVRKELVRRNPDFDGALTPTIENEIVTGLMFKTDHVSDISPVRALTQLKNLTCRADADYNGKLIDLSPLKGLPLTRLDCVNNRLHDLSPLKGMSLVFLYIDSTQVTDLSPLRNMPLQELSCGFTKVADITPLKGLPLNLVYLDFTEVADLTPLKDMPLTMLGCGSSKVTDLSPLKDMRLASLTISGTAVSDLSPLQGMRLQDLYFTDTQVSDIAPLKNMFLKDLFMSPFVTDLSPIRGMALVRFDFPGFKAERDAKILRPMGTLTTINGKAADQFWKEVDQGKDGIGHE